MTKFIRMNEADFWRWLRQHLPPGIFTRIESPGSPGVPDVHFILDTGIEGWIELKSTKGKVRPNNRPFIAPSGDNRTQLHASQRLWIDGQVQRGANVKIAARIGSCVGIWTMKPDESYQFNGWTIEKLRRNATFWSEMSEVTTIPEKAFEPIE